MALTFADYEDAVLLALQPLLLATSKDPDSGADVTTGYLLSLAGQAGQIQMTADGFIITTLQGFPAVVVEVFDATYKSNSTAYYTQEVTLNIFAVARSWRDQAEARGGDQGAYQMLSDIRDILHGNTIGLDIRKSGLELQKEQRLIADKTMVIYLAAYRFFNDRIPAIQVA